MVARVSYHALREERAFHIAKTLVLNGDTNGDHIVKPIDLLRLAPVSGDRGVVTVAIYSHPGQDYLRQILDFGPAYYEARKQGDAHSLSRYRNEDFGLKQHEISLQDFLDFAVGATQCLELLHHGQNLIHGEIRGDAFHFNLEENKVRIVSFGSGLRSFEHGLTSTGWSTLSKELGAKNKLQYISPEQTGRMPAEPDSRTDIYSLGVLFWSLLTQKPPYDVENPLDIVHLVLTKRIPDVSSIRLDVPDVLGRIIQKCTAKAIGDRYASASGLRHDLIKVRELLGEGNEEALINWTIGSRDVSSFFMLPNLMIGRDKERAELIKVLDRVSRTHSVNAKGSSSRFSDGSTLSTDVIGLDDVSSEGGSSVDGTNRRSGSFTYTASSDTKQQRNSAHQSLLSENQAASVDTLSSTNSGGPARAPKPWDRQQPLSMESRSLVDSGGSNDGNRASMLDSGASSLSRQLGNAKFRRRGHCEVVAIEGTGGLGKSCLVSSVVSEARRRGYCATAKFDTTRRVAFGPLLKLLSSLFKQVWGERNTETPFHQGLKQYMRPVWPMLHKYLDLPEFLLGPPENGIGRSLSSAQASTPRSNARPNLRRRTSSPESSQNTSLARNPSVASQASQDFLRGGSSTKTMRLMNTFLDVLRVFTSHKLICLCLDDLHFADEESLELISQIINARMKMVIIVTYRPDELSPERMQSIIHPPDTDEFPRSGGPLVTRLQLQPLSERDIIEYVSTTLCRPLEETLPLALVIQSKSAGNPFYIREMLSTCHRKRCIWYDYRDSQWHFDLDKLFENFKGQEDYDILDTDFITRRLDELPQAARAMLAWGALLGNSFSFALVTRLMDGEFHYNESEDTESSCAFKANGYTQSEMINGLQAAIQAYVLVPSETDDRFRFAHDRYVQAAANLRECNSKRMHFVIAQTLMKYYGEDPKLSDSAAFHICGAVDIIKTRVPQRQNFRKLLIGRARTSTENGARPTAAKFYSTAVSLLQEDPWTEAAEDVSYDETMQLYLRSAECYLFMGHHAPAHDLLDIIFRNAKTAIDRAPAYVLQSRIYAQNGNAEAAVASLKECLGTLGVELDENPTQEMCDDKFDKLVVQLKCMERPETLNLREEPDAMLSSIGAVLSETISAAWWSDSLRFYYLSLVMLEMHLSRGSFPQSGMAFLYVAIVALARFNLAQFAVELGDISQELLNHANDTFSSARGLMLYPILIGHIHYSMPLALSQMEDAIEMASSAGDRMSAILAFGLSATVKFFASENVADLEAFCQFGCEEIPNWHFDTRGGALLLAVRQTCRALQGKTSIQDPLEVLSDEQHNASSYKNWLVTRTLHSNRSTLLYESLELVPLFLYGHYERAVSVSKRCMDDLEKLWSVRNSRLIVFLYGLSLAGKLLRQMHDPRSTPDSYSGEREHVLSELRRCNGLLSAWMEVYNVNYLVWVRLLEAQISELSDGHGHAVQNYEEALDHAAEHNFLFEEALGNYLLAGFFLRRKARRCARAALLEAVGLFKQLAAIGVATSIEEEHSLLLHGPTRNHRTTEIGVQTDFVADSAQVQYRHVDGAVGEELTQTPSNVMTETKGERTGAWTQNQENPVLPTLDVLDLNAILESSRLISSVLDIEDLLKKMCGVILKNGGGSRVAIILKDEGIDQWSIAASGEPEKGSMTHNPHISLAGTRLVAENVVLYCTRFYELVFIPDILTDERFGNVPESWLQQNPMGKSIIAIPIKRVDERLLGVLYLEGEARSFNDRHVAVLQLLVAQLGISYSNALAMKKAEKANAEKESMVVMQKRALAKAIEAETKAKDAEAEAKRNVKLAEEAAKAKSIFLANVSHELRTPLNGVIGNSELLRDRNLNKEQLEMADSIRVSADLLLTVINDILDFSKMEADKMKLYIIAFNPEEMVREVVRAVSYSNREKTSKKNVKIIQDINLPPMLIYGDPIRLHQVLGNLIGNSLKFTEDGSITIGARLDSETEEQATLTFWVRDTGIGIPPQQLAKLFQPFSQADASTARKYGGSGLGLSICKSLIEIMMKGKIQLESEETVGTTAWFTVSFDKAKSDVSAGDAQSTTSPTVDRYSAKLSSPERASSPNPYLDLSDLSKEDVRICVAEDNPINQKIAIQYVQRLGYHNVSAYENGMKAVEGLRQNASEGKPYHIVLMDVQMPILDGYEATKLIRKDPIEAVRKILVIAMTASAIQGDREKCLAAGMNDYLAKPVRSEVLKKKLEAYLSSEVRMRNTQ